MWGGYRTVVNKNLVVEPSKVVKLDKEFNPVNVRISRAGKYRVYAEFNSSIGYVNSTWEFNVG
jgi:hypothetical protein